MARSRNIKPSFFKNPELADAGPVAQLLFAGLWCLADRDGRLKDQPRVIKAELFPYYDADVNGYLTVLERLGNIRRYSAHGIAVIEVVNFKKHQSPHHTERASELPCFDDASACLLKKHEINSSLTVNSPLEHGGNPPDSLIPDSLIPDSLIPDSPPTGKSISARSKRPLAQFSEFDAFWETYDKKIARPAAERSWRKIKLTDELLRTILDAARLYRLSTPDKTYRKNPATWLNNECWNDEVIQPTAIAANKTQHQLNIGAMATSIGFEPGEEIFNGITIEGEIDDGNDITTNRLG